ncbi:hypothetical protein AGMMS49975_18950 [Clostridia bacterium]|nr:hypothetical protein AGMMS49975_18950 [Clostridia bacterium]
MLKRTHQTAAVGLAVITTYAAYRSNNFHCGIHPYLAVFITTNAAMLGGVAPDLDVPWENVPEKNPIKFVLNKLIYLAGDGHRSRLTHSIDLTILMCAAFVFSERILDIIKGYTDVALTQSTLDIAALILLGFISGWVSHILADMATSAGVRLVFWGNTKVRFFPKKIGKFKFSTGEAWEDFFCFVASKINIVLWILYFAPSLGVSIYQRLRGFL